MNLSKEDLAAMMKQNPSLKIAEQGNFDKTSIPAHLLEEHIGKKGSGHLKVTEEQFANTIEDALDRFGWRWCHIRPARTEQGWRTAYSGDDGLPDYPLVLRGNRALCIELKSDDGILAPEQYFWLVDAQEAGLEVYLWQPKDEFQLIIDVLK